MASKGLPLTLIGLQPARPFIFSWQALAVLATYQALLRNNDSFIGSMSNSSRFNS